MLEYIEIYIFRFSIKDVFFNNFIEILGTVLCILKNDKNESENDADGNKMDENNGNEINHDNGNESNFTDTTIVSTESPSNMNQLSNNPDKLNVEDSVKSTNENAITDNMCQAESNESFRTTTNPFGDKLLGVGTRRSAK